MIDTTPKVREHCSATGLTGRIESALATIVPDGQPLTVDELAPLDSLNWPTVDRSRYTSAGPDCPERGARSLDRDWITHVIGCHAL